MVNGREDLAVELLNVYDWFLSVLNDQGQREALEKLSVEDAARSDAFHQVREYSHRLQKALVELFFDDTEIGEFSRDYGVF